MTWVRLGVQDGCTALHHAAYAGRLEVTNALLAAGASSDVADGKGHAPPRTRRRTACVMCAALPRLAGKTPLEDAKERGHDEVAAAIEKAAEGGEAEG